MNQFFFTIWEVEVFAILVWKLCKVMICSKDKEKRRKIVNINNYLRYYGPAIEGWVYQQGRWPTLNGPRDTYFLLLTL